MPFTALHPDAGRLDATLLDLGRKMDWAQLYKVRPRVPLTCPECTWGVHAKVSRYGVRFFCHDPGRPPSCELSNESWEHHMLKLELAGAIRAAGWYAELEVPAEDGSWRADVMASSPDGAQRMAWEAQLSPITVEDIRARTARYRGEKVGVCWVCPHKKPPQWMGAVPAVRVRAPEARDLPWVVDDGVAGFDFTAGGWVFREEDLHKFVRWVLHGQLAPCRSLPRYRRVTRVIDDQHWVFRRELWWTSRQSARTQTEHEEMRQRQEKAKQERETRKKQQEAEAERRRKKREEAERLRRAEEAARRRKVQEEEHRVRMEEMRRRWAEEEARRQREQAEQEEKERQALETAKAWWARLSRQQIQELFTAVAERAWREEQRRVDIPENPSMAAHFAYGVPLHSKGRFHALYGIVRPCPDLVSLSPQLSCHRVFVRNAQEARQLGGVLTGRITHFDLPDHEQLTMY
ncbi:competence protein CoiA family protein [Streptomyces antimycoticus]|uniref:competence protein CoiA family protein n=1 Tax=Streptomyces antimycoticus TaxID=68175 RepID=UPI0037D2444D